jgi:hypothetical protein
MADPAEQQPVDEAAELEAAVGQAIEACGGDPVDAVRALIVANSMLERWPTSTRRRRSDSSEGGGCRRKELGRQKIPDSEGLRNRIYIGVIFFISRASGGRSR